MAKLSSVLLVDDDPTNNYLHQRLLNRLDVAERIQVATNGQEALAVLQQASTGPQPGYPVLILLDIQMPVMNGLEFLEAYQQLPAEQRAASKVVVLTTSTDARDLAQLEVLPIADLVNKPLTQSKLESMLQLHFSQA